MKSQNTDYLPGIDHLRALAALLITFFHGFQYFRTSLVPTSITSFIDTSNPFFVMTLEGHTAVSLFMTLSGFIFTYIGFGKTIRYSGFIRNRILRIFPLFIVLLVVGFYSRTDDKQNLEGFFASLLMFSNSPAALDAKPFTTMFWTIAIEFQFYLIFPWLLIFLQKDGSKALLKIIAFFAVLRILVYFSSGNALHLAYWTIVGRIDQFCIGMIAAKVCLSNTNSLKRFSFPIFIISVAFILVFWGALHQFGGLARGSMLIQGHWRIWLHTVEALIWAGVIISYIFLAEKIPSNFSRMLCFLGSISYSVYLTHFIVINILCQNAYIIPFSSNPNINAMLNTGLLAYPLIILLSSLSYFAIEKPFLDLRVKYTTS